jgi:dihydroorotase
VQAAVVDDGRLDWADVARVLSEAPARIGQVEGHGQRIAEGGPAEITLYDPAAVREFSVADLAGQSQNSPYLGMQLPGRVVATFHHGYPTLLAGELVDAETVAGHARAARTEATA